jgi:hypothetical protein
MNTEKPGKIPPRQTAKQRIDELERECEKLRKELSTPCPSCGFRRPLE